MAAGCNLETSVKQASFSFQNLKTMEVKCGQKYIHAFQKWAGSRASTVWQSEI